MSYFTDEELQAATEAVSQSILAPYSLSTMSYYFLKDAMHRYVQRLTANALTAAAQQRGVKP
jgi:hypothetical protein